MATETDSKVLRVSQAIGRNAKIVGIVFVVLKLTGLIAWPWWWVLAPWLVPLAGVALVLLGLLAAMLIAGCGGADLTDLPPDCQLPHNTPESSCNPPTPTYQVCWPGDGTYWILYDSGERVHQTLGKTAHVPVLCHVAPDGTWATDWKDGL